MVSTFLIGDRRELGRETGTLRLLALIDFSLILFVLLLVATFSGFSALRTKLFFLSAPHLVLAPLAGLASLRLGALVYIGIVLSAICLMLDSVQWWLRLLLLDFDFGELISIIVVTVFIIIDGLYILMQYRVRVTDEAQNIDIAETDKREAILKQEANTLRVSGIFGFIVSAAMLFFCAISLFRSRVALQAIFSVGHLLAAPYAVFLSSRGIVWMWVMLAISILLAGLDVTEIVLRIIDIRSGVLTTLTLTSLFTITLLLINFSLFVIDLMYFLSSSGWLYAHKYGAAPLSLPDFPTKGYSKVPGESQYQATVSTAQPSLNAYALHRRAGKDRKD
jgi:hypothetical protein